MWSDYVLLYTDISLVCSDYVYTDTCLWSDYTLLYTDISLVCGVTTFYCIEI